MHLTSIFSFLKKDKQLFSKFKLSDFTVFNFCMVLLTQGYVIIFNLKTNFSIISACSRRCHFISLSSLCVTSCLPPHSLISVAWSRSCRSELATDWTVDKNDFPYARCGHHRVSTSCLHSQKVRKWCDDGSSGRSDPAGCVHSYLRRSEIVVEEVLTRLCRHVLSQMRHRHRHRHAHRQVRFICIPVCVSAGFTGEEDSSNGKIREKEM